MGDRTPREGIEEEHSEVAKYWFLIEKEMLKAIIKGNLKLIPVAKARIEFLKRVVHPKLLKEGTAGVEEALCDIHTFLYNSGWWEKANKLDIKSLGIDLGIPEDKSKQQDEEIIRFILSNQKYVHPNTIKGVKRQDEEDIRMTLNQIHYGSLQVKRALKDQRKGLEDSDSNLVRLGKENVGDKQQSQQQKEKHRILALEFIAEFRKLVEPTVFDDAQKGDDKALSLALGQIHHKSLGRGEKEHTDLGNSYKDALLSGKVSDTSLPKILDAAKSGRNKQEVRDPVEKVNKTLFISGFGEQAKQLWELFKKQCRVRDIILPRKRDRYNKRFGFVVLFEQEDANRLIQTLNGRSMGKDKLYVSKARNKIRNPGRSNTTKSQEEEIGDPN